MQLYYSHFAITDCYRYAESSIKGKAFQITFEEEPVCGLQQTCIGDQLYPAKAIVIHARSSERAQYVADMIFAAYCLHDAELPFFGRSQISPFSPDSFPNEPEHIYESPKPVYALFLRACLVAAKASFRKNRQYALFKFLLSRQILPIQLMSLDPSHWWPGPFVLNSSEYHIHCAYAIVIAYSILEELGLEIRASAQNPSTINGKWNPVVKSDLENRLIKAGVNLSEKIYWDMRDTPTKIERVRTPKTQAKAEWAYGKIRDAKMEIVDAIAYANWLRSKVSAHKLREFAGSLSYYDATNVQLLARRLLLETLGYWD